MFSVQVHYSNRTDTYTLRRCDGPGDARRIVARRLKSHFPALFRRAIRITVRSA